MTLRTAAFPTFLLFLAGCPTTLDYVCNDIGFCTVESTDQVRACQSEATALGDESYDGGCGSQFDGYFSCARGAYQCTGATVTFPGCESSRAALDACLATERASNSCGALATALAACSPPDAGAAIPSPCSASAVCAARCYLEQIALPCAPLPSELALVGTCTSACP